MQQATVLAIGNAGITIPNDLGSGARAADSTLVKVIVRVPVLNAGIHTVATSDDDGVTWDTASGPIALTGYEPANPTPAGNAGNFRAIYGPYLPGTKFRITSSVAQTAAASVRFGI